ncbi:MAG: 1-(5-phosphoribosyl)-5-[(5-phosphoribosylamino)methylideneamino]imidazole-4-carboxamide isomerase [Gammaproteobacteria bacterium]|nr:1-(5-phosphoribosyl)-5-[(5-phosphoribosylamino)methylideneamino]imidazole-4-carboxamide isomerase [Gammaproteobacteria bacterium]MDE0453397.1 1-(5-phosphoribosyl)-5-[(5-phosphoribosylamino)methylideneamino]imidazole-4-carboxamide isomerase [Gammaproteobacteria bacterium]
MILIPAIDIQGGRCVQLRQGVKQSASVYGDDPVAMAERWTGLGARRIHVVDLDGAFAGRRVNAELVRGISAAAGKVPVQVGGGIRDLVEIESYLAVGVSQVIVGTRAIEDPTFLEAAATRFPGQVILGLDARAGRAATAAWDETTNTSALDVAARVSGLGLFAIVFTDIERDGMLTGVNADATAAVARASGLPVIASGGVRDEDDLRRLCALHLDLLLGVIAGSALYEGTLDFTVAQALLDRADA